MLARERVAQSLNGLRPNLTMIPTRPSPARSPKGGVPAAGWTFFGPHAPNSVARAGERVIGCARAAKTRATILLVSEIDQPLGALARPAMRRAFFIPR